MIRLSVERILLLHQLMIAQTGGSDGVRDMGLLESAVESMYASFDGKDLYPGKEEKAARLGFSLIANHAFIDGNKRIGMYAMLTFLEVNGILALHDLLIQRPHALLIRCDFLKIPPALLAVFFQLCLVHVHFSFLNI